MVGGGGGGGVMVMVMVMVMVLAHQRTDYAKKRDIILSLNDADPIACRQGLN